MDGRSRVARLAGIIVVAVGAMLGLGACGDGGGEPTETVTVIVTVTPDPPADSGPGDEPTEPVASDSEESPPEQTFVVPDLVGMNLQDAQDALQALGSYLLDQEDASGEGRLQIDDSNWQVCTQEPAPGTEVPLSATIRLDSVKLDEVCP